MIALQPHDRVVFYGVGITEQRLYTTYVEDYAGDHWQVKESYHARVTPGAGPSWTATEAAQPRPHRFMLVRQ